MKLQKKHHVKFPKEFSTHPSKDTTFFYTLICKTVLARQSGIQISVTIVQNNFIKRVKNETAQHI